MTTGNRCGMKAQLSIPARSIITTSDGQHYIAVPIGTHWIITIPRWWLRTKSWLREVLT